MWAYLQDTRSKIGIQYYENRLRLKAIFFFKDVLVLPRLFLIGLLVVISVQKESMNTLYNRFIYSLLIVLIVLISACVLPRRPRRPKPPKRPFTQYEKVNTPDKLAPYQVAAPYGSYI